MAFFFHFISIFSFSNRALIFPPLIGLFDFFFHFHVICYALLTTIVWFLCLAFGFSLFPLYSCSFLLFCYWLSVWFSIFFAAPFFSFVIGCLFGSLYFLQLLFNLLCILNNHSLFFFFDLLHFLALFFIFLIFCSRVFGSSNLFFSVAFSSWPVG